MGPSLEPSVTSLLGDRDAQRYPKVIPVTAPLTQSAYLPRRKPELGEAPRFGTLGKVK